MNERTNPTTVDWDDVWAAVQELGAALRPVFEFQGAPPEWATKLADALDEADRQVTKICQMRDQYEELRTAYVRNEP